MPNHQANKRNDKKPLQRTKLLEALGQIRHLEREMSEVVRAMEEKVRQLECLNDFSRLMNSSLDQEVVRTKVLKTTCQLLRCETASLFLIDEKKGELYWGNTLLEGKKELKKSIRIPIDNRSLAGAVAMTGESLIINDVQKDPRHAGKKVEGNEFKTVNMICLPLKVRDKMIGVLEAINKLPIVPPQASQHKWPDFHEEDKNLLEALACQVAVAIENSQLYQEIKKNFFDTVQALAEAIEKKDHYTGGHTKRVVYYAMCIAKFLPLSPEQCEQIRLGAILHDVGKIGIEDKILKKEAPLDPAEWKIMKRHPDLGYEIMARVEGLKDVTAGMRYHHERWDGKGYPIGLKGEEIPFIARVIAVADAYDAMVSTRPYRKGIAPESAYEEILRYKGTQFDPQVVEAFQKAFQEEKIRKGSRKGSKK